MIFLYPSPLLKTNVEGGINKILQVETVQILSLRDSLPAIVR